MNLYVLHKKDKLVFFLAPFPSYRIRKKTPFRKKGVF